MNGFVSNTAQILGVLPGSRSQKTREDAGRRSKQSKAGSPGRLECGSLHFRTSKAKCSLLGGGFTYFSFSPLPGEVIQFDDHIFQRGWFNHQPDELVLFPKQFTVGFTLKKKRGVHRLARARSVGRGLAVAWAWLGRGLRGRRGRGLGVAWAWRGRGVGVAWAWLGRGLRGRRGRGLGVAWAWLGRGLGVAWAWLGRGVGVAWAWLGRGVGVAWAWRGRGLGVANTQLYFQSAKVDLQSKKPT